MSGAARRRGLYHGHDNNSNNSSNNHSPRLPRDAYDGPASRGSMSGPGSQAHFSDTQSVGSHQSQGGHARQSSQNQPHQMSNVSPQLQVAAVLGTDPARENPPRLTDQVRNIDLPASWYDVDRRSSLPTEFKRRPGYNTTGKAIQLALNCHQVTRFPSIPVYQYDVVIGSGAEKRAVLSKVWESRTRKQKTGSEIIYDGNKLAWSSALLDAMTFHVDLDAEEGRTTSGKNQFRVSIRKTTKVDLSILQGFLDGWTQITPALIQALSFLDHLLREGPSQNPEFIKVMRSFFNRNCIRADLGGGIEVFKGVYQSIRLAEGKKMVVNVDVSNTCFWQPTSLTTAIVAKEQLRDIQEIGFRMKPDTAGGAKEPSSFHRVVQSTFKGVFVNARYSGNPNPHRQWKIFRFDVNNAKEETIEWKDLKTKQPTGQIVSIAQYFQRKYGLQLQYPQLPLVEMTKKGVKYPMELLHIVANQRYPHKLNEVQTSKMIKFAVLPPSGRLDSITKGRESLGWGKDRYLSHYGLQIEQNTIKTNARLLPSPGVKFGNKVEQPGTRGRWDLRGKTFLSPNPQELVAWGVGFFGGRIKLEKATVEKFVLDLARAYRGHGGRVAQGLPHMMMLTEDAGQAVEALHQATGNKYNRRPQLLVFIVQDKNAFHYLRIKKSCDCRYGVVSQVLQASHVQKNNPQYHSNVLMKVNAKLGGCTSQAVPHASSGFKGFKVPTMVIGADVSHASPGSPQASMAAISVSFDKHGGRFVAACQTNGHRVEMITDTNMRSMLGPLATQWTSTVGGGSPPAQVYYFRDGVSERQFSQVISQEIPQIRAIMSKIANKPWAGKITAVVATKRHHVRIFPKPGSDASDPKGNPLPGSLVERDATMPYEWDFYMVSHIALQGTARPCHYTIIHDEADHKPEMIQNMIYEHCYQYMRSTTSVSLYPAVYYAHLASNRAKAHEDISATKGPQTGPGYKQNISHPDKESSETRPLLPMFEKNGIKFAMWYI